jgi:hypothetical protein
MDMHSFVSQEQPSALKIDYTSKEFLGLHKSFPVLTLAVKKVCVGCRIEKPLAEFSKNRGTRFGHQNLCKLCSAKNNRESYTKNKDKNASGSLAVATIKRCSLCKTNKSIGEFGVSLGHRDGKRSQCRSCVSNYNTSSRVVSSKNTSTARQKRKIKWQLYRLTRKTFAPDLTVMDKVCVSCTSALSIDAFGVNKYEKDGYSKVCKKCQRLYAKARNKNKSKTPEQKLTINMRNRILKFLKGLNKSAHTAVLVGCSKDICLQKIKDLFWPGMTEENNGPMKWHVDHVLPLESFDKTDQNWQFKAFHWSNIQPLWANDNRDKWYRLDWSPLDSKHELPERLKRLSKPYWNVIGVK